MKSRPEYRKEAHRMAEELLNRGFGQVLVAFDYRVAPPIIEGRNEGPAARFFYLPAEEIVAGVASGELPLGDA